MILACGGWTSVSWEGLFGGLLDFGSFGNFIVIGAVAALVVVNVVGGVIWATLSR